MKVAQRRDTDGPLESEEIASGRPFHKKLFPDSRLVWLVALFAALLACLGGFTALAGKHAYYTGTSSTAPLRLVTTFTNKDHLCINRVFVPADTRQVQIEVATPAVIQLQAQTGTRTVSAIRKTQTLQKTERLTFPTPPVGRRSESGRL